MRAEQTGQDPVRRRAEWAALSAVLRSVDTVLLSCESPRSSQREQEVGAGGLRISCPWKLMSSLSTLEKLLGRRASIASGQGGSPSSEETDEAATNENAFLERSVKRESRQGVFSLTGR